MQVKPLEDVYLFEKDQDRNGDVAVKRETEQNHNAASPMERDLQGDARIGFVLEQVLLPREPREYTTPTDPEWSNQWTLVCLDVQVNIL